MRLVLFSLVPALMTAQDAKPAFEVASIRLHPGEITLSADPSIRGSRVVGTAITLVDLLTYAYGVRYGQISGVSGWAKTEHYDINAKAEGEGPLGKEQARLMMQTLLTERFHLQTHRESKDMPVYALVVARNGHKLKQSAADAKGNNGVVGSAKGMRMEATRGTMEQLARQLSGSAGRPVVDRTGLTGYWAYTFEWIPASWTPEPDSNTPSMFTAIQEQLGLRLEPSQAPFDMLVVDRAERPSAN